MFKVGDKVACIADIDNLSYGKVYTVLGTERLLEDRLLLAVMDDMNEKRWYYTTRFTSAIIKNPDPQVTIPESEYHSLIEEVNMLQELVKELSAPQDTALEQQAETYLALNDTLTRHESFQEGEDGVSTTRCEELLNTIDFLHEVYDDWKTNDYQAAVASAGSDAFKPISEYTLEDWQQAIDEDWKFECRDGHTVKIDCINYGEDYPIVGDDGWYRNIAGAWYVNCVDQDDIVKRIR